MPESLRKRIPRDYELRSSKKVKAKVMVNEVATLVIYFDPVIEHILDTWTN